MSNENLRPVIVLAFANDLEDRTRYLRNLAAEARRLREALEPAERAGLCEIVVRQNVTVQEVFDLFQGARYRNRIGIFHYGGHADSYQLLFEGTGGKPAPADAAALAAFLGHQRGLQLVFLNGCSTQQQVQGLLDAGVAVVVATAHAISDQVATEFAARFYTGLAGGGSLRTAFGEAQAALRVPGTDPTRGIHPWQGPPPSDDRTPWERFVRPGAEAALDWNLPQAANDPLYALPPLPKLDLPSTPYRNLEWFRREDAEIFFGRGQEIAALYRRVAASDGDPIVLFYGQSGVGKSSVMAAGLLPRLEGSHEVRYCRRDQSLGLAGTLAQALMTTDGDGLAQAWHAAEAKAGRPLLVVLDQVEEVFTRPNPELPREVEVLVEALATIFGDLSRRPLGRLILSFRKEWLAEIEKRLEERRLPRGKVFLERLSRQGIVEVVSGPTSTSRLRDRYNLALAPELPGRIADDLLADRDSPVAPMLQILLGGMWQAASAQDYDRPQFSEAQYDAFRRQGLGLDDFLTRQLQSLADRQRRAVESGLALDLLAFHTTPLGTAEQHSLAELEQTYSHQVHALAGLVQDCRDLYLLVDPARNGPAQPAASRLTHDTLAAHVRKRFEESDRPGQRARRVVEGRAVEWQAGREGAPLDDPDLALVEDGLHGMRVLMPDEMRMLATSRAASDRRRREREQLAQEREEARQRELRQARELAREQELRAEAERQRAEEQAEATRRLQRSLKEVERAQRLAQARELSAFAFTALARRSDSTGELALLLAREAVNSTYAAGELVDKIVREALVQAIESASPGATSRWRRRVGSNLRHPSYTSDGQRIVGAQDGGARIVDAADGTTLTELAGHAGWVESAVLSPDDSCVLTAGYDGNAKLWDAESGKEMNAFRIASPKIYAATFHPDGTRVLTAGEDGIARVWDIGSGKELLQIYGAKLAAFSPDGTKLCTSADYSGGRFAARLAFPIVVWDSATGRKLNEFGEGYGSITCQNSAAFSPTGDLVVVRQGQNSAGVWDVSSGREVHRLSGHTNGPTTALFSPDGSKIVTAGADGTVRIWDAHSGEVLLILENLYPGSGGLGWVNSATFSPDNQYVLITDSNDSAELWLVGIPLMLEAASSLIHREFTEEEEQEYLHRPRPVAR